MNEDEFSKLLMNILVPPDYEKFEELTQVIDKYDSEIGLAAAICATAHTWCEEHGVDPVEFFDKMFTVVFQQVVKERENGLF